MRVHILSDLHMEFGHFELPEVDADLVVLAGDIHTKLNGIRWIRETLPDKPVVYLAGNHEYYGEKLPPPAGQDSRRSSGLGHPPAGKRHL